MSEFSSDERQARDTQLQQEFLAACAAGGLEAANRLEYAYDAERAAISAVLAGFTALDAEIAAGDDSGMGPLISGEYSDFKIGLFWEYAEAVSDYQVLNRMSINLRMNAPHD